MPFPYFQRQLSQEHPDINLYTLLGYCNWERLFLTLRFTFFLLGAQQHSPFPNLL